MHSSPSTLQHAASGVCVQHATRAPVASRTPSAESMPREQPRLLCAVQCARPCRHETGVRRRVRANDPIKPSTPRQQQRKHRRLMRLRAWARPAAAERGYLGQYSQGTREYPVSTNEYPCEYYCGCVRGRGRPLLNAATSGSEMSDSISDECTPRRNGRGATDEPPSCRTQRNAHARSCVPYIPAPVVAVAPSCRWCAEHKRARAVAAGGRPRKARAEPAGASEATAPGLSPSVPPMGAADGWSTW